MTPRRKGTRKMITTGAITSRKLAMVSTTAELVYWRAYMACDNYGTFSADPWDVMQAALPGKNGITEDVVRAAIDELADAGLLERWIERDGEAWMHILGHDLHQQSSWLARRGVRRSPVPPSLRIENDEYRAGFDPINDDTSPATASERTLPSPHAESVPSPAVACSPTTTTSTTPTTTTTTIVDDEVVEDVTARSLHPSNPKVQIRKARGELGRLAMVIDQMVANAEADRDRSLTEQETLDEFYRPAVELLLDHGVDRLSVALGEANRRGVTRMQYVATVCRSNRRQDEAVAELPKRPVMGDPAANLAATAKPKQRRPMTLAEIGVPEVAS